MEQAYIDGGGPQQSRWGTATYMNAGPDGELKTVIARIETRMAELNTNAKQLSKRAGLGDTAVYDLLKGKNLRPALPVIKALAKALDCDLAYLVGDQATPRQAAIPLIDHYMIDRGSDGERVDLQKLDPAEARPLAAALQGIRGEVWELTSDALAGAGYQRGDFLVVDMDQPARPRDIVLATHGKNSIFRLFLPPYLYTAVIGSSPPPMVADGIKIIVRGVVVSRFSLS